MIFMVFTEFAKQCNPFFYFEKWKPETLFIRLRDLSGQQVSHWEHLFKMCFI